MKISNQIIYRRIQKQNTKLNTIQLKQNLYKDTEEHNQNYNTTSYTKADEKE